MFDDDREEERANALYDKLKDNNELYKLKWTKTDWSYDRARREYEESLERGY